MTASPRRLHLLALPLVASFTLRFAFGMVDLVYASQLPEREAAVAAIAFYIPFQEIYIALWVGLSAGFTAALSAAFGRRDQPRIEQLQRTMRRVLGLLVPTLAALGALLWPLAPLFGLDEDLTQAFRIYGTTMLVGMPLTGFWSIYPDSVVKAHHDTRTTMMAGLSATLTNVSLNSLFVFVFGWGLFGIGLATVLSRLVALVWSARVARRLEASRQDSAAWQQPSAAAPGAGPAATRPLHEILALGLPSTLTFVLTAVEGGLINRLLAAADNATVAIASWGVFYNLQRLALMPTVASAVAVLPFVARMVPEGHAAQVRTDLRLVALFAAGFALLFTLPTGLLFPAEVGGFFLGEASGDTLTDPLTLQLLHLLPIAALAMLPFLLLRSVFEALGRPRLAVRITLLRFALLSYPLLLAGWNAAGWLGVAPPVGMLGGFMLAGALTSLVTALTADRLLRQHINPS